MNRTDKVEIYQGEDDQWYWRYRRANGKVMADGSQGYSRRAVCVAAATYVLDENDLPGGWPQVVEVES